MTRQEMSDPFWLGNNIRLQVWPLITITYSILMAYILRSGVTYAAHVRQTLVARQNANSSPASDGSLLWVILSGLRALMSQSRACGPAHRRHMAEDQEPWATLDVLSAP